MRLLIEYFLISAAILILFIPLFVFIIYRYFKQRKIRMVEAITSKNSIQLLEPIAIGNIKQWIEVLIDTRYDPLDCHRKGPTRLAA